MEELEILKVLETYKRFRTNSALVNEQRDLIEDYASTEKWIKDLLRVNQDDTVYTLLLLLVFDAQYLTTEECIKRRYKYSKCHGWDTKIAEKGKKMVQSLTDADRVGDVQKQDIMVGNLTKFLRPKLEEDYDASVKIFIFQRLMIENKKMKGAYKDFSNQADLLLHMSNEEEIRKFLNRYSNESEESLSSTSNG